MELESSYQLLGVVRDDGIRTYRAVELASCHEMQVHIFAKPESETDRTLFKALRALPESKRREILEIGIDGTKPYVITEKLPNSTTARDWLMRVSGSPAKSSSLVYLAGSWKTGTPIPEELLRLQHPSVPSLPGLREEGNYPAEISGSFIAETGSDLPLQQFQTASPASTLESHQPPPVEQPPVQPSSQEPTSLFQSTTPSLPSPDADDGECTQKTLESATPNLLEPPAQAAPEPQKKAMLLIYTAGGAMLLAMVLIIVFFVLQH